MRAEPINIFLGILKLTTTKNEICQVYIFLYTETNFEMFVVSDYVKNKREFLLRVIFFLNFFKIFEFFSNTFVLNFKILNI